jgi:hypothetical protein
MKRGKRSGKNIKSGRAKRGKCERKRRKHKR